MPTMPYRACLAAGLAVLLSAGSVAAQQGQQQGGQAPETPPEDVPFVYINSQQLLQEAPGANEAQKTWKREMSEFRSEVQQLRSELDSLQQAYQQQEGMLSESARQKRREEIAQKQRQLQQRMQELEQKASQRRQELLAPILDEVRAVIQQVRDEYGYSMVFDAAAAGLLAANPRLDITDTVVRRMRQRQEQQGDPQQGSGAGSDGS